MRESRNIWKVGLKLFWGVKEKTEKEQAKIQIHPRLGQGVESNNHDVAQISWREERKEVETHKNEKKNKKRNHNQTSGMKNGHKTPSILTYFPSVGEYEHPIVQSINSYTLH